MFKIIIYIAIAIIIIYVLLKTNLSGFTGGFGDMARGLGSQLK